MKPCVIGGAGFIGTSICRNLTGRGVDFVIVDQKPSVSFPASGRLSDIRDMQGLMATVEGDTIIHLAAVHRDDVRPVTLYDEVNVEGTRNVCRVASAKGINRIVFASSVAIYGFAPENTSEDGKIAPFNAYGRTKHEGETILCDWQRDDPQNRCLVIVRPTVVFGPGNRGNVFNLMRQVQSGFFVMVGNGRNRKSLAYVENVAAYFVHCLTAENGIHVVNYADKPDLDMNALVSLVRGRIRGKVGVGFRLPVSVGLAMGRLADVVAKASGRSLPISWIRVKKFITTTSFASTAHETAGFRAPVDLRDGLTRTLESDFIHPDPDAPVFFSE